YWDAAYCDEARATIKRIMAEYRQAASASPPSPPTQPLQQRTTNLGWVNHLNRYAIEEDDDDDEDNEVNEETTMTVEQEFGKYLLEPLQKLDVNMFTYWPVHFRQPPGGVP
ncbi:hypothetical protein H0H92_000976, partial [Tricholoma furcatifolium]